jgi:hypothetical protein
MCCPGQHCVSVARRSNRRQLQQLVWAGGQAFPPGRVSTWPAERGLCPSRGNTAENTHPSGMLSFCTPSVHGSLELLPLQQATTQRQAVGRCAFTTATSACCIECPPCEQRLCEPHPHNKQSRSATAWPSSSTDACSQLCPKWHRTSFSYATHVEVRLIARPKQLPIMSWHAMLSAFRTSL